MRGGVDSNDRFFARDAFNLKFSSLKIFEIEIFNLLVGFFLPFPDFGNYTQTDARAYCRAEPLVPWILHICGRQLGYEIKDPLAFFV